MWLLRELRGEVRQRNHRHPAHIQYTLQRGAEEPLRKLRTREHARIALPRCGLTMLRVALNKLLLLGALDTARVAQGPHEVNGGSRGEAQVRQQRCDDRPGASPTTDAVHQHMTAFGQAAENVCAEDFGGAQIAGRVPIRHGEVCGVKPMRGEHSTPSARARPAAATSLVQRSLGIRNQRDDRMDADANQVLYIVLQGAAQIQATGARRHAQPPCRLGEWAGGVTQPIDVQGLRPSAI